MAFELLTTQQVPLTLQAEDSAGQVVADPGTRTWASTDETVVTVSAPDGDGNVTVVAVGAPGTATVTVSDVEPDTNDGAGATFVGSLDFIVSAPADPITQIVLTPGTPTDKPA